MRTAVFACEFVRNLMFRMLTPAADTVNRLAFAALFMVNFAVGTPLEEPAPTMVSPARESVAPEVNVSLWSERTTMVSFAEHAARAVAKVANGLFDPSPLFASLPVADDRK